MPWRFVFLLLFAVADVARVPSFGRAQPAEESAPYVVSNSEVQCWTGQQMATAMADPAVGKAVIMRDVKFADDDFAAPQQPGGLIIIRRNLTIRGGNSSLPQVFDLNYLRVKVQLVGEVTLRLENLFLVNYRRGSATQQPGFDFLTAARDTAGHVPVLKMVECYILYKYCFPPKIASEPLRHIERPAELPGNNTFELPYSFPYVCTRADVSPAAQQQQLTAPPPSPGSPNGGPWSTYGCFQHAVLYTDVAVKGGDMDDNGSPLANSTAYPVHALNTIGLCINVLTMECIAELGPLGCFLYTIAPPGKSATPPPGGVQEAGHQRLPVILGASIGGGVALLLIGAAAVGGVVVARKRRRLAEWRHDEEAKAAATSKRLTEGPPANDNLYGPVGFCSDGTLVALAEKAMTPRSAGTANRPHQGPLEAALLSIITAAGGAVSPAPAPPLLVPADGPSGTVQVLLDGNEGSGKLPAAGGALGGTQQGDAAAMAVAVTAARVAADGSVHVLEAEVPSSDEGTVASSSWVLKPLQWRASRDDLDPLTPLTPLQPGINLDVVLDGTEVKLNGVTLGKGGFGRVVEGLYCGQLVAVKIIDHGLLYTPQPLLPHAAAAGRAVAVTNIQQVAGLEEGGGGGGGADDGAARPALGRVPEEILAAPLSILPTIAVGYSAAVSGNEFAVGDGATSSTKFATASAGAQFTRRSPADTDTTGGGAAVAAAITAASCSSSASDVMYSNEQSAFPCATSSKGKVTDTAAITTTASTATAVEEEEQQGQVAVAADAVQQPHPQSPRIAALESALKQEVEVLARCQHPNIVRLLAACLRPPRYCLVLELMETSLERLLYDKQRADVGLLPLDMVLNIATQIAHGLAYLHPTVMHRDLKPANVLISHAHQGKPVVKLADFGLSRLRNTVLITRNPEVGTAPYVSPEAFDIYNHRITDRVDVYALGIILWEMLSGQRPWRGFNIVAIALSVSIYRHRPPLDAVPRRRCPDQLRALIEACWDHVPERRPASAEVAKRLVLIQQEEGRHARSGGPTWQG